MEPFTEMIVKPECEPSDSCRTEAEADLLIFLQPDSTNTSDIVLSSKFSSDPTSVTSTKYSSKSTGTEYLPPCRICGAVASGFHYGVNTCEACKAFYRRCTSKGQTVKLCPLDGNCTETIRGRLACVPCRFQKCLDAGMTKQGSKKGRYTHQLRTQYTEEIKAKESTPQPKDICDNSTKPVPKATVAIQPQIDPTKEAQLQETSKSIIDTAKECFPELRVYMERKHDIDRRVDSMISEQCQEGVFPTVPIYSPGILPVGPFKMFKDQLEMAMEAHKSATPGSRPPINLLWASWMAVAEILFVQLTKFAKKLKGFRDLSLEDQIILLKDARIETSTFIAHPSCVPSKNLVGMYEGTSEDILLCPVNLFPESNFTHEFADNHIKIMARLQRANYCLDDMCVIIPFLLLSSDREDLSEPEKVEELQHDLLAVLEYTLKRNHPNQANILAETLLVLPAMREHSATMKSLLTTSREANDPDLSPLMREVL